MAASPSISDGIGATLPTQPVGWQGAGWQGGSNHSPTRAKPSSTLPFCHLAKLSLRARTRPHTGEVRMQNREQLSDAGTKASCTHLPSKGGAGDEGG